MGAWEAVARTVAAEFSDVSDVAQFTRIMVRLLLASMLGFALGFERERKGKAAGVRTHMLVAIGSAVFVLVPQQAGGSPTELSRVIQGLLAGIGFLCAGTILKSDKEEAHVQGLTTAAGLWMTAGIGLACGLGREVTAVLSSLLALVVLALVPGVVKLIERVTGRPPGKGEATQHLIALPDDDPGQRP